jgi:Mrp family chromosome partitioning ATPase
LPPTEAHAPKNLARQKAEPAPEKKTDKKPAAANQAAQDAPSTNQPAAAFSDGWTEDFTRAFSNLDQNAPIDDPPEPAREQDLAKTPAEIIKSLAVGMKQCAAAQVPLPEKNTSFSGKKANQDIKRSPSGMSDALDLKTPPKNPALAETSPAAAIRLFQPMLQVDHFAWPKVCGRLETVANAELEHIIETLIAAQIRGKKVFALGGCHSGDGATSLLLATARRLAAQDIKAALVEADWSQPQLARRLGLLPQYGWEDVLSGRLPLEEVLIESIAERLVILPVREPFRASELPADVANRLTETWNSLRHHFDIVLVDPGPLCNSPILDRQLVGAMAGRIDAALMVKNLRRQDNGEFDAVGQALNNAGAKVIGVVENFTD